MLSHNVKKGKCSKTQTPGKFYSRLPFSLHGSREDQEILSEFQRPLPEFNDCPKATSPRTQWWPFILGQRKHGNSRVGTRVFLRFWLNETASQEFSDAAVNAFVSSIQHFMRMKNLLQVMLDDTMYFESSSWMLKIRCFPNSRSNPE